MAGDLSLVSVTTQLYYLKRRLLVQITSTLSQVVLAQQLETWLYNSSIINSFNLLVWANDLCYPSIRLQSLVEADQTSTIVC